VEEKKGRKDKWPSEQVSIEVESASIQKVNPKKRKFDEFSKQGIFKYLLIK
jgi:hypothetical protein